VGKGEKELPSAPRHPSKKNDCFFSRRPLPKLRDRGFAPEKM